MLFTRAVQVPSHSPLCHSRESRLTSNSPFEFELKKGRGIRLLTAIRFVPRLPVSNLALLAAVVCYLTATTGFEAWRVDAAMSARA